MLLQGKLMINSHIEYQNKGNIKQRFAWDFGFLPIMTFKAIILGSADGNPSTAFLHIRQDSQGSFLACLTTV